MGAFCGAMLLSLLGCEPGGWRDIHVGQTRGGHIESILQTSIKTEDRYVYGLSENELVMVSLDEGGSANGKYYWHEGGWLDKGHWEMLLEAQISSAQIRAFSRVEKYREEAVLAHMGGMLFDTSRQFDHIADVAMFSQQMNQIMAIAIEQYGRETQGQSVSGRKGFVFEGQGYGAKCTMKLKAMDKQTGIYRLAVTGYRRDN